jgi:hypothetical protein
VIEVSNGGDVVCDDNNEIIKTGKKIQSKE